MNKNKPGDWTITSSDPVFRLGLMDCYTYRTLILALVKRDLITYYRQTILGPLWLIIQPSITTLVYTIVFGGIGMLPSDGLPKPLFYLSGIIIWSYFAECLAKTSTVLRDNHSLLNKVYFPRIVLPVSISISLISRLGIQFLLLIAITYFYDQPVFIWSDRILLLPVLLVLLALLGIGFGMVLAALTTKYRDLNFLTAFGIQLLMYTTTVIYPLSLAPERLRWLLSLNPVTTVIETFRYIMFGEGMFTAGQLAVSALMVSATFVTGLLAFHFVERRFIDVV